MLQKAGAGCNMIRCSRQGDKATPEPLPFCSQVSATAKVEGGGNKRPHDGGGDHQPAKFQRSTKKPFKKWKGGGGGGNYKPAGNGGGVGGVVLPNPPPLGGNASGSGGGGGGVRPNNGNCFNCGKPGQISRKCPDKKK